ncbi:rod shape-determining protein MreD [Novosphingobium sp. KCTC 2891]|uniref:rod shape-determining protein MreD n=1 Tax=Novosphingobium sp. KCTC 2891 TaxID=2989730 RepID=UPI002221F31F|nr:rod shape-determining protein MreD [Novosphingobium sp. KCTC 2891]MCW1381821.1 rod shape-determining protein MreD [Novosphingobium sp. KCTC 2891]
MILPRITARPEDLVRNRINRAPSPLLAVGLPWASVMLASMVSFSPIIASAPVLPPLAFMVLLAWRMLRPSLLPVWIGLPLGAWDDLFSGQPFGSAIVLWSAAMLAMEVIDARFLWRGFVQDWLAGSALLAAYLLLSSTFASFATGYPLPLSIGPQLLLSVVVFPPVTRVVALLDRVRLLPLRRL